MSENQGFSSTQMFLALLGGAAVGAAVALLTAPTSGSETRTTINDAVASGRQRARGLPGAVKSASVAARDAFSNAMEEVAG